MPPVIISSGLISYQVLRDKNIDCIVAPFEADAQLAYLNKNQLIDVVLSEDSDLLVFGCSEVHVHFFNATNGSVLNNSKFKREFSQDEY